MFQAGIFIFKLREQRQTEKQRTVNRVDKLCERPVEEQEQVKLLGWQVFNWVIKEFRLNKTHFARNKLFIVSIRESKGGKRTDWGVQQKPVRTFARHWDLPKPQSQAGIRRGTDECLKDQTIVNFISTVWKQQTGKINIKTEQTSRKDPKITRQLNANNYIKTAKSPWNHWKHQSFKWRIAIFGQWKDCPTIKLTKRVKISIKRVVEKT